MIICPDCNAANNEGDGFCFGCQNKLTERPNRHRKRRAKNYHKGLDGTQAKLTHRKRAGAKR